MAFFTRNFLPVKRALMASSNTEDTLCMLMAEHSTYFTAAPHSNA